VRGQGEVAYQPMLFGAVEVRFADAKTGVDTSTSLNLITPLAERPVPVDWDESASCELGPSDLESEPEPSSGYGELPAAAGKKTSYAGWSRDLAKWVYGSQSIELFSSPTHKAFSTPGESEADFRIRLQQAGREKRDAGAEELRKKYAAKTATLEERLRKAMAATEREAEQAKQAKLQTAISIGGTVLGAFLGRKKGLGSLGRATTAARGVGRAVQQSGDVKRAEETVGALRSQLDALEVQFQEDANALAAAADPMTEQLTKVTIKPKKTDISVQLVALAWAPSFVSHSGELSPGW
jgi:hypothetical protein